jgi:hypothetical protein
MCTAWRSPPNVMLGEVSCTRGLASLNHMLPPSRSQIHRNTKYNSGRQGPGGREEWRVKCLMRAESPDRKIKNVLKMDGRDGCTVDGRP